MKTIQELNKDLEAIEAQLSERIDYCIEQLTTSHVALLREIEKGPSHFRKDEGKTADIHRKNIVAYGDEVESTLLRGLTDSDGATDDESRSARVQINGLLMLIKSTRELSAKVESYE